MSWNELYVNSNVGGRGRSYSRDGGGGSTTFRGERRTPGLYGSNTGRTVAPLTTTTATEEDRVQIAAQAMQDYMDQDDGDQGSQLDCSGLFEPTNNCIPNFDSLAK
jgi:hypothetical protein